MKKLKKVLLSIVALTLVAALSVAGTLAYLQSETDDVVNTFEANQVTVTLTEDKQAYNIIPGTTETKNPTVTVTNSIDCYVYIEVTDATSLADGKKLVEYEIETGPNAWQPLEGYTNVYYREVAVNAADADKTFNVLKDNKVTYPASLTNEDMLDGEGKLRTDIKLSFKASAVQKEPFADEVEAYTEKDRVFTKDLNEAAQAAANGKPVEVQADVNKTYTEAGDTNKVLEPADGSSIDFKGNTLTIESASGQNGVQVSNGASTTLSNGTITMDKAYGTSSGVVDVDAGEATLENMTVINSGKEGVCVSAGSDGGKVTLIESTVSGGGKTSPAVYCGSGSTVVIEGGKIVGNINSAVNARIELRGGDYTEAEIYSQNKSEITVYGGKFSFNPSTSTECRVDANSIVQNNGDGTYTVVSLDDFAPVTVANADALNTALQTTGHVQLANDIPLNEELFVEVPNGVKVLLDLNGHVITGESKSTRNITNSGTMIIRDSSAAGTGEIRNSYAGAAGENGSFGLIDNYGKLTIESGTFTNVAHGFGSAIKNRNGASLTITGGTVRSEVDDSAAEGNVGAGNLLISSAGDLKISGGTFILKGSAKVPAIEVYNSSSATITNATITSSDSQAIQVWDSYVKITNAAISSEKSNVIEANGWSEVEIKNSTVTGGLYAPTYVDPEYPDEPVTPSITITSGTFTVDPAEVENCKLATGSTVVKNADGTWTVKAK